MLYPTGQLQLRALSRCLIVQEQEEILVVLQKGALDASIPVAYLVIEAGPTVGNSKPRKIQAEDALLVSSRDSGTLHQPLSVPEPDFLDGETSPRRRLITHQLQDLSTSTRYPRSSLFLLLDTGTLGMGR